MYCARLIYNDVIFSIAKAFKNDKSYLQLISE